MLRSLSRFLGYCLLAGAFIALVVDGTRTIASSRLAWMTAEGFVERLSPAALASLRSGLAGLHPMLWDPVTTTLLRGPLVVVLFVLGLALVLAAAGGREPEVGTVSRR
ncbi:hypothetical protein [Alsobacter sp. R-9]